MRVLIPILLLFCSFFYPDHLNAEQSAWQLRQDQERFMRIPILTFLILGTSVASICFAQTDPKNTDSSAGSSSSVSSDMNNGNNGGSGDYGYDRKNETNVVNEVARTSNNDQTTNSAY